MIGHYFTLLFAAGPLTPEVPVNILAIAAESRRMTLHPEFRALSISAEGRALELGLELRTVNIAAEPRTLEATR